MTGTGAEAGQLEMMEHDPRPELRGSSEGNREYGLTQFPSFQPAREGRDPEVN
jgi:hypothetical protein